MCFHNSPLILYMMVCHYIGRALLPRFQADTQSPDFSTQLKAGCTIVPRLLANAVEQCFWSVPLQVEVLCDSTRCQTHPPPSSCSCTECQVNSMYTICRSKFCIVSRLDYSDGNLIILLKNYRHSDFNQGFDQRVQVQGFSKQRTGACN